MTPQEKAAKRKSYFKIYNDKNKERIRDNAKRRRSTPEAKAKAKAWCDANKERVRRSAKKTRLKHTEKWKAWHKTHYLAHPEYEKQRRVNYYQKNKAKILANQAWRRSENPEKFKTYRAAYYRADPERARMHADKRRAQKAKASIGSTSEIYHWNKAWRKKKQVKCHWCLGWFHPKKCEQDHVVSLSRDGEHTLKNLVISCRPCNRMKHAKPLEVWTAKLKHPPLL